MEDIRLESIMNRQVQTVEIDCPVPDLVKRIHEQRVACVVVCLDKTPVGVISERDIVRVFASSLAGEDQLHTAQEMMSFPPFTLGESQSAADAMSLLAIRGIRRAPVINGQGNLVGIVTHDELLVAHKKTLEKHNEELEAVVEQRTQELTEANAMLESQALEDKLMGIGNRRSMELILGELHEVSSRYKRSYVVVLFDVDHFKAYNDNYGHQAGDDVLRSVADALKKNLRAADTLFRYGGEELLMVLPETDGNGGLEAAERACASVQACTILHEHSTQGMITVSGGIASAGGTAGFPESWAKVIERADRALYRAKDQGRNRVLLASADD